MSLISIKLVPCRVLPLLYGDRESCHVFLPFSLDVQIVLVHSVKVLFLMTVYPPSCIIIICLLEKLQQLTTRKKYRQIIIIHERGSAVGVMA